MDKVLLKTVLISSIITGALTGLIPLIPAFTWAGFLALMFLTAPVIIIYLKNTGVLSELVPERIMIISSVAGFAATIGFCLTYMPIAVILQLIFKIESFLWIKTAFVNFGFIIPMIIFTGLLSAIMNAFSGFMTIYFYETFTKK